MTITFTHRHALDPDWNPGPGQKWKDAPKARMRVTKMTATAVFYTYTSSTGRGSWYMSRVVWDRDYAPSLPQATTEERPK